MAKRYVCKKINTDNGRLWLLVYNEVTLLSLYYFIHHQLFVKSLTMVATPKTPMAATTIHPIAVIQTGCR
jgi:hypothetical protein